MKEFLYSFYGKLSAVLLLLLLILGTAQLYITYQSSLKLISAADQQINLNLAEHIAGELEPELMRNASADEVESVIQYLMVYNPRIEIYVLNQSGKIINFFADPAKVKMEEVTLEPVQSFVSSTPQTLILGDDPRNPGIQKPFSAAMVDLGDGQMGYLYIILSSQQYNSALEMIRDGYIIGTSLKLFAIILVLTAIIGLILFGVLTRRLRTMTDKVETFEQGDYSVRLDDTSRDEVGQLAGSFNHMADTIQSNVKELQKTDELRRDLIANVSHDLRSPLASMQGYLETILIKEKTISEDERKQYLQVILNNTELLRKMVEELFELSKLDARQTEPDKEPFSIADLTQDVYLKVKNRADKKGVTISDSVQDNLPQVIADIGLIERVLTNLLENAIDYTVEGGEIDLSLKRTNGAIEVAFTDTGTGIKEEDLPYIFDRFYRADKSRSLSTGNTGLGLAIAKKILELHGTDIHVKSESGEGTRFYFNLPVYPPRQY